MNLSRMRLVDHWLGLPACFCLGVFARIGRILLCGAEPEIVADAPIAVLKFFGLGSVVQAGPLVAAIRQRHPDAPLVFVTFAANAMLLEGMHVADTVIAIRTGNVRHFLLDTLSTLRRLRKMRVQATIDLEFFSKYSTLLSFLSGARLRVGFHLNDFWRYSLINRPVCFNYFRHITEIYADVGRWIGVPVEHGALVRVQIADETRAQVRADLERLGVGAGSKLVGININADVLCLERRWPLANWLALIRRLLEKHPKIHILLTGAASEREYVTKFTASIPQEERDRVSIAAGVWDVLQFVAALEQMDLFITNDSGPMHLAATTATPTVSLWGPQRPAFYEPKVETNCSLYEGAPCSPCLHMFTSFSAMWCNHEGWCMKAIHPDSVARAVESMLARGAVDECG